MNYRLRILQFTPSHGQLAKHRWCNLTKHT